MKVLHIIECGIGGGTMEFVHYLIKYQSSFNHTIICGHRAIEGWNTKINDPASEVNPEKVKVIEWKNAHREINIVADTKAIFELNTIVKNLEYDVVMLHSSKAGFLGRLLFFFIGFKKVIYVPHGVSFLRSDVSPMKKRIFVFLEKVASWLSGKVICNSKSEADSMINHKIPASYIYNGSDMPGYSRKEKSTNKFIIASVGRLCFQKNPRLFNEIAKAFINKPNVQFIWIGDGEDMKLLDSPNIKCTGWVTKNEVYDFVSNADLYLSTSLWEGLPYSVIEAMNLRKPLLLHRCVGNIDMVEEGQNGYLFDSTEEAIERINELMKNKIVLSEMGEKSFNISSENFTAKTMSAKYELAYSLA